MEFSFSEEQSQFRDYVARFCRDKSPISTVRTLAESELGFDPATWKQMCQDLGLVGIHLSENVGGSGFGPIELGIVMEELGRSLLPSPYLSVVMAASSIACISDAAKRDELLVALTSGNKIATLAINHQEHRLVHTAAIDGEKISLQLKAVLDAAAADTICLLVGSLNSATLIAIDRDDPGVTLSQRKTMDGTRRVADVTLENATVTTLGELNRQQINWVYNTTIAALCNEMSGGAQALIESTIEYTKMRIQFGRAIGSFQALKHRLADLHVDVELAKVAAWQAAAAVAADEDASANVSLAKFTCSEAYLNAALEGIQLRGGIGFTWENDTHLWYRRAKSSEVLFGKPAFHRNRLIEQLTEELCP